MEDERERDDVTLGPREPVRCFRCGRLVPAELAVRLRDDCPAVFRDRDLCPECGEVVRGAKSGGWWAAATRG
jgi:hypothetical protein